MVQWLRLGASNAEAQVQSLFRELDPMCCMDGMLDDLTCHNWGSLAHSSSESPHSYSESPELGSMGNSPTV